jgi:hypothetical protein
MRNVGFIPFLILSVLSAVALAQKDSPGKDREANWLPVPDGPFYLSMRLYGPKPAALNGGWKPPFLILAK